MNADGSNLQQLTSSAHSYVDPNWFPDGRRIFVSSGGKFVSVDAETRQQQDILKLDREYGGFQLSPDGSQVAAAILTNGVQNVWLMDLATKKLRQLTFDQEDAGFPAWSPDGKFIAFQIVRGPDNSIFVMPSAGGAAIQLTPYHGQRWHHGWSPDGDKILFAKSGDDLIWNIWSVSRTTKVEKQLTQYLKSNSYVRYPTASPRGNQIVYEYTETTGNIWMMEIK
jgi:TolB protein